MKALFNFRTVLRASFLLGFALALAGCKEVLFAKLNEPQANEVLAALSEARIDARKERVDDQNWKISVDNSRLGDALVYLRDRGLPVRPSPTMGEVFKKDGMISTPTEERARFAWALQESIAATLRRIDGVTEARVHVALPKNDPLSDHPVPASASVFIKHRQTLDAQALAPQIKSMVMASVEGLDYRNISMFAYPVDTAPAATSTRATTIAAPSKALPDGAIQQTSFATQVSERANDGLDSLLGWLTLSVGGPGLAGFAAWWWDRRDRRPLRVRSRQPSGGGSSAKPTGPDSTASTVSSNQADDSASRLSGRSLTPGLTPGIFAGGSPPEQAPQRAAAATSASALSPGRPGTASPSKPPPSVGALATLTVRPR